MEEEYCSSNGHVKNAVMHLIVELWNGQGFYSLPKIKKIFEDSVKACGAFLFKEG